MKLFLCLLCLCFSTPAYAACTTNLISIGTSGVAFGNYDSSLTTANTANGTITVSCTLGGSLPSFTLALSKGNGSFGTRQMNLLTATLNYNLYTTSALATVWGDGTSGTVMQSYGGGSSSTMYTVYGAIPARQFVTPGIYGDTITITVTF